MRAVILALRLLAGLHSDSMPGERENGEGLEWGGSLAEKVFGSLWGRGRGRHLTTF